MITSKQKDDRQECVRKTQVQTTYEYVPILGEILGYWRKVEEKRAGETIEIYLNHSLEYYDRIVINGKDITDKL